MNVNDSRTVGSIGSIGIADGVLTASRMRNQPAYYGSVGAPQSEGLDSLIRISKVENGWILGFARSEGEIYQRFICMDVDDIASRITACLVQAKLENT